MAGALREQALPLLAAANKHGDLAVKISSLKQARGILLSAEPSLAAELFPYLIELQSSPEVLVRKHLIEVIEEIGMKAMRNSSMLMPVLLTFLKDNDSNVAMQSIISGTNIFCSVLEELSLQFRRHGIVESWLEELWSWMIKFKDAVFGILYEAASVGTKLLGIKFLETYILLFTPDASNSEKPFMEDVTRNAGSFNISRLVGGHPILDPVELVSEANRAICFLLDLLQLRYKLPGCVTISVVNSLAAIARRRPVHYSSLLSTLLELDLSFETSSRVHTPSIQYALRTAFLGFLRCTHPVIVESRERLLRALRAMNAGDASDQVLRQVDKLMRSNGRASRDARVSKDEHPSSYLPVSGDPVKKRLMPLDNEEPTNAYDIASKKICYASNTFGAPPVQLIDSGHDYPSNGVSPKVPLLNSDLTPVEQMIAMIGALIAEGERGVESLKILISKIQPDLLADIVMTNMKHLPKYSPPLTMLSSPPITQQSDSSTGLAQVVSPFGSAPAQTPVPTAHVLVSPSNATSLSADTPASINLPADSKRDPRRDPRRLDPRRVSTSVLVPSTPAEDSGSTTQSGNMPPEFDASNFPNASISEAMVTGIDDTSSHLMSKSETDPNILGSPVFSRVDQLTAVEELQDEAAKAVSPDSVVNAGPRTAFSTSNYLHEDLPQKSADPAVTDEASSSSSLEADQPSSSVSNTAVSEESCLDLPVLPLYVELKEEQERDVRKLAVGRIIDSYRHLQGADCKQTRMILLARLVAQIDTDDNMIVMMQKHVVSDYQQQQGHELVMHVLYHLHPLMSSDSLERSSFAAGVYEKFLLVMAKSLLDALPATDKSFSRLLGEAPSLPDSIFKLLDDICSFGNYHGKAVRDGDRITQGLGAVWSLILGRPLNRQACLDIALKCAVNPQDDVRAKAIRLVANKLYVLDYSSAYIEEYSIKRFLSAVDMHVSDVENSQSDATEHRTEGEMGSQETSISGSQFSEPGVSENVSLKGTQDDPQSDSPLSFAQAQRLISLFFALCTKKSSLLQLAFDNYARAPKAVKQAIHHHVPILMRALESSYPELLRMIADPPDGCENLLTQVLHILSEGSTPLSDLVATVKRLYETKLKDATILIPVLSSFSKNEVLPIIPRLVDLPLDKFQTALAHILQGSAHTGPALTPTEVLVAIHDIRPEKDGVALKKITDACSACFEQRMVFTQQVLSRALNQMVNQTPLPLLFMRTVIQAIDAYPSLVNFVMEILSKLVNRQVWRMPKLWVGFLKCVYQTQPHSFHVLLQLPSAQLDSVLNRYANLRDPLAAYANQPSVRSLLPRSTQVLLGLAKESHPQQPHPPSLHAPDTNSSVHGTTLT